jgi:hypothetical protein
MDSLTEGNTGSFSSGARLGTIGELVFSLVSNETVLSIGGISRKRGADEGDLL